MKFFSDKVLVVSKKFVNENDVLVCFMSKNFGVFWAVAKNGRKSKKRFVNTFEQPCIIQGYFRGDIRGGRKIIIERAEILENFEEIKSDFIKILCSWFILSLSKDLSVMGEIYDVIIDALYKLRNMNHYETFKNLISYSKDIIVKEGFQWDVDLSEIDFHTAKKLIREKIIEIYGNQPKFLFILDEIEKYIFDLGKDFLFPGDWNEGKNAEKISLNRSSENKKDDIVVPW